MATMSATMKQFTKGLKTALEPMSTSMANIEQALVVTASREDIVEGKKNDKKKLDNEIKQTSLLQRLFGKKDEKSKKEEGGFFSKHWGKILTAMAGLLLFLPKDFLKEKLFNVKWWEKTAWVLGGALVTYLATKAAWSASAGVFGGAIAGAITSSLLTAEGGKGMSAALKAAFKKAPALGVAIALIGIALDGIAGYNKDGKKSVQTGLATAFGGQSKGGWNALIKGAQFAAMGAWLGAKTKHPAGVVAGLLLGAALGGIAGYIGGDALDKGIDAVGEKISEFWKNLKITGWIPGTDEYKAKAQKWADEMAPLIDKFIADMWENIKNTFKKMFGFTTGVIKDAGEGIEAIKKNDAKPDPTSYAAMLAKKNAKILAEKKELERLRRMRGKTGKEDDPLFWFQNNTFRGDGSKHLTFQKYKFTNTAFGNQADRNWIKNVDPGLLLDYIRQGGSLQSWGIEKSGKINMVPSETRETSWTHLSETSKSKTNILARFWEMLDFGKMQMTSGYRTIKENETAMIEAKNSLNIYKRKWRNFIREKFGKIKGEKILKAGAKTDLREEGVKALMNNPAFRAANGHLHGNGIDIAYPPDKDRTNFNEIKAQIQDVFPGANVLPEKGHLHIQFDPAISPEDIRRNMNDLQKNNLDLQESRAGGGGGNNTFVDSSNKNFVQGGGDHYHFGDGAVNPDVARLSGYDPVSGHTFS